MSEDHELQNRVEAVIFAIGKSTELEAIASLVKEKDLKAVKKALDAVRNRYDEQASPLMVVEEGSKWKLTVRERYLSLVRNIVADTELSKTVMETLAVVAWKNPVKQSDIIRIRTNKAYDHLAELEELGFITRQKYRRTKLIKLTEKFFQYFELEGDHSIKEVLKPKRPAGQTQLPPAPGAGALPAVETYGEEEGKARPSTHLREEETEHLGNLEVIDEPEEGSGTASRRPKAEMPDQEAADRPETQDAQEEAEEDRPADQEGKGPEGEGQDAPPEEGPVEHPFDEELEENVLEKPKGQDDQE